MKRWLLRIAVVLSALAVAASGSWYIWREFYSADHFRAAKEADDAAKVYRLLRWGARADEGENLLHWAAQAGHPAVAKLLLANGADPNAKKGGGWTPLHLTATANNPAVAKSLLANGAKVDAVIIDGRTPLHLAVTNDSPAIAKLLLSNGADPNAKAKDGSIPLDRMPELAELVKKLEADKAGTTP